MPVMRLMGNWGAGEAVEGDQGGEAGGGAVEVADGHGAVGMAGVEAAADHEGAADCRPVDAGGEGRGGAEGGAGEGPAGHGVVDADAEQVAGESADPGLGDRDAAGQGHEGDLGVVLVAADAVGVAADPEALGGGDEGEGAHAAVTPGVPGQGQAVDRVEGGDALAGDRARAGLVGGEAVVHPALVAADVDRGPGDGHTVEGVAAGVVDPGRLLAGPRGPQLPAGGGVAQAAGPVGAGGPDHEVAAVGRDVDIAHVGVEHRGALLLEAGGGPVGDADRGGGQVEDDDLVALQAGHERPVADGDQPAAVGADVEVVDVDSAGAGAGEGQVDVVAQGPGDRVDGGQGGAGHAVDGLEGAADVEAAAAHGHVLDPGVGLALEGGDPGAVAEAELDQALLGDPVDLGEAAAGEHVQPVGGDGQRLDLGVEHGRERGVDRPGGGVEGEDVAPGDRRCRRGGTGHLGELAPGDDLVPDLDDGGDLAVEHVRRLVRRVARHHRGLRHVDAAPGCAIRPTRTAADSSANRTRRPMWGNSSLSFSSGDCAVVSYRLIGSPGW